MKHLSVFIAIILLAGVLLPILMPRSVKAWSTDPTVNTPVCTAEGVQMLPAIVGDGSGGAIVSWVDYRDPDSCDVFAQRLDSAGVPLWAANGVYVCTTDMAEHAMTSDGSGGAIIVGQHLLNDRWAVYAQRVDSSGVPQWTAGGVVVSTPAYQPSIISDGFGGAIIAWHGKDIGGDRYEVRLQRVNAAGVPQWAADGVYVCNSDLDEYVMTSDELGGAIITWQEGPHYTSDIYAQRLDSSGTPQWGTNGLPICTSPEFQSMPVIASDGSGGAIIAWHDARTGKNQNVYAQKVDAAGVPQWTANGVVVSSDAGLPTMIGDGSGGAIIAWLTGCYSPSCDIYAQRLGGSGATLWAGNGLAVCTAPEDQTRCVMATDGSDGAIFTWLDSRKPGPPDVYAQRMDASGSAQWATNGIAVCAGVEHPFDPAIIGDGSGGAIVTWHEYAPPDIFAQSIGASGSLGWDSDDSASDDGIPFWVWIIVGVAAVSIAAVLAYFIRRRLARH